MGGRGNAAERSSKDPWDVYLSYQQTLKGTNPTKAQVRKLNDLRQRAYEYEDSLPKEPERIDFGSIASAKKRGNFKRQRRFK